MIPPPLVGGGQGDEVMIFNYMIYMEI